MPLNHCQADPASALANALPAEAVLLDAAALGRLLCCSARHVRRLAAAGELPPPVRLGHLVRWSRAAIETWIAARTK